jgi:hypothetical protein
MHQAPTYTTWKVICRSPEDAESLRQSLSSRIDLNRVMTDVARAAPDGKELTRTEQHRLSEYFVTISPLQGPTLASLRLVFQRRANAGRFWKDLMVNVLQEIESAPQVQKIELESKGELHPDAVVATR